MNNGNRGSGEEELPPGLAPEVLSQIGAIFRAFAPHLTEAQSIELAQLLEREQLQLGPFLVRVADAAVRKTHPRWGIKLAGPDNGTGFVVGPKLVEPGAKAEDVISHVMVLALVTSSIARGILRAWGFTYEFVELKQVAEEPLIVV